MSIDGINVSGSSKEILVELLNKISSPTDNQSTSVAAKDNMKALSVTDAFGVHLIEIVIDPSAQLPIRHLASEYLINYNRTRLCVWNIRLQQYETKIKQNTMRKIKKLLLLGLRESISEIRTAIANVISDIAFSDWPRSWPDLQATLIDYLKEEVRFVTDGAMQVLLCANKYRCPSAIVDPAILQEVTRIFAAEKHYSVKCRGQAVTIFTKIVDACHAEFIQPYLHPAIPMFCQKIIQDLSEQNNFTNDSCALKTNILKAITMLTKKIPKCMSDFYPEILPVIWKTLIESAKFHHENKNISRDVENADVDFDGDIIFDNLVEAISEFICALMNGSPHKHVSGHSEYDLSHYHWLFLQDSLTPEIFRHLITLMEITDDRIEEWNDEEPSTFLRDEEWLGYPERPRGLVQELVIIKSVVCYPKKSAANALAVAILTQMDTEMTNSEPRTDWISQEAFLLAFCLAKDIIVEKLDKGMLHFDLVAFFENVVFVDLDNPASHPLLIGRCLCLGGLYAEQMPPEIASRFLEATASGLSNELLPTRLLAAIATKRWFRATAIEGNDSYKERLGPHLPIIFRGLFDLGCLLPANHIAELVLENLYLLALFHKTFRTSTGDKIYTLTVSTYVESHSKCDMYTVFKKLFEECERDSKYVAPLHTYWLPMFIDTMTSDATDEAEQTIGQNNDSGETGLHYILQSVLESKAEVACEMVRLLAEKIGNTLPFDVSAMKQLLRATEVNQVHSVLHQRLLMIWAHLVNNQTDDVFDFLSTAPLSTSTGGSQRDALTFVMGNGLRVKYKFFNLDERKTVTQACCKILEYGLTHQETRLHYAVIKEALDVKVPFLVNICQLITNEWSAKEPGDKV